MEPYIIHIHVHSYTLIISKKEVKEQFFSKCHISWSRHTTVEKVYYVFTILHQEQKLIVSFCLGTDNDCPKSGLLYSLVTTGINSL